MGNKYHRSVPEKAASTPRKPRGFFENVPEEGIHLTKAEVLSLDPRLVRMVLRVSPELQEDLINISERLYDETRLEYSYAAIIRGLISLGLASIAGKQTLAVEFAGCRVPRGRKRGPWFKRVDDPDE